MAVSKGFKDMQAVEDFVKANAEATDYGVGKDGLKRAVTTNMVDAAARWLARFPQWNLDRGCSASGINVVTLAGQSGSNSAPVVRVLLDAQGNPHHVAPAGSNFLCCCTLNDDADPDAVRDAHADPLLAADDGPDTAQGGGFDHWGSRKAGKVLDTFPFENLGYRFNGVQRKPPPDPKMGI